MTFQRENRYIVVKIKDLDQQQEEGLRGVMYGYHIPTRECLVIESDWPEYEPAWRMIQARVEGATLSPAHIEDGEEVEVVGHLALDEPFNGAEGLEIGEWEFVPERSAVESMLAVSTGEMVPLMTVAQHQRIVAALSADNQRVVPPEPILADPHPLAALSAPPAAGVPEGITIERDMMGTMHVKVGDFDYVQVRYQHPYTDNASTRQLAERIAALIAAPTPPVSEQPLSGNISDQEWINAGCPPASEQQRAVVMPEITGTAIVEVVNGAEGPSLYIGNEDGGYRLAGPKPWGGGRTIHKFTVKLSELVREAMNLAKGEGV